MSYRGDETGMFWHEETEGRSAGPRILPPIPHSDWSLPEGPEAYPNLAGQGAIAIDVETYDPHLLDKGPGEKRDGRMVGLSIGTEAGFRQYYPFGHENGPNLPKEYVIGWAKEQLRLPVPKIGANLLYELGYLEHEGVKVEGPFYDIQVADPLLDETQLSYSLENISQRRLGRGKEQDAMSKWLTRAFGEKNIKSNIWRAPTPIVGPYAESDVDLPLRIFAEQRKELEAQNLWELFEMESDLIPLLHSMRQRGVPVDQGRAEKLRDVMKEKLAEATAEVKRLTGIQPDIWASESLAKIFDKEGLQYPRTDKTNAPSFRKEWLEQHPHPIAKLIQQARRLDKFRGTFVEGYILNSHNKGRIYCTFNQLRSDGGGTVSGRFSSSHPNMQNLPIRDPELGPLIRDLFVPEEGQQWWKMDWSQIEFRLAVHYAALTNLPGARTVASQYHNDPTTDYHAVVAALTGLPRSTAKSINFGIIYGLGVEGLCQQIGVTIAEGMAILDQYHRDVPFAKPLYNKASRRANHKGEIVTVLKRRRRFNIWEDKYGDRCAPHTPGSRRAFTHKALNALLQGSAADIMKTAMVKINKSGVLDVLGAPHLTVHDELDGSLPEGPAAAEALKEVRNIMATCVELEVPMIVDQKIGPSWGKT